MTPQNAAMFQTQRQTVQPQQPSQPTESSALDELLRRADAAVKRCDPSQLAAKSIVAKAVEVSATVLELRGILTDAFMQQHVMPLMNTQIGFRTDRPQPWAPDDKAYLKKPYTVADVREGVIVAMMKGAALVNNEFNIIAGNAYMTKEFYGRSLRENQQFSDLRLEWDVPVTSRDNGKIVGAVVPVTATWRYAGMEDSIGPTKIPVKADNYTGIDGIIGKAEAKILHRIYSRLIGSVITTPGEVDTPAETVEEAKGGAGSAQGASSVAGSTDGAAKPGSARAALDKLPGQPAPTVPGADTGAQSLTLTATVAVGKDAPFVPTTPTLGNQAPEPKADPVFVPDAQQQPGEREPTQEELARDAATREQFARETGMAKTATKPKPGKWTPRK